MGLSPKSDSYNLEGNGLPLLNGAADFSNGILIPGKYTTDSKREAKQGDLVFCIRATIGLLTYTDKKYSLGRGVASIRTDELYREFVYFGLDRKINHLISRASGSVIIGLKKNDIETVKYVVGSDELMEYFHLIQSSIFNIIKNNTSQIECLKKTRDTLLPKLLSGELDVSKLNLKDVTD